MKGRKPKPTHLRLVQGNPGKRKINRREPRPTGALSAAPDWFQPEQRVVWDYAIQHAPPGLLTLLDCDVLVIWCVACDMQRRAVLAQAKLDAAGGLPLLSRTPEGHFVQSPYLPIINRQGQIMLKAAAELGFTPSSRSRIEIEPAGDAPNKASLYFA